MILDIDAGNTRLKWRLAAPGSVDTPARQGNLALDQGIKSLADLPGQMGAGKAGAVQRIRVASVRGEEFREAFTLMAGQQWQVEPEFAVSERQCAGVTNAYQDVRTMGVDRWLAMLSAYDRAGGACCVLDCGSAITFDWINGNGKHQGGYIVPGLALMQASLASKTPSLAVSLEDWRYPGMGDSTPAAISGGILAMVIGFARQCREQLDLSGGDVQWFLTGGDAELVGKYLDWPVDRQKDLVLDGLALALP